LGLRVTDGLAWDEALRAFPRTQAAAVGGEDFAVDGGGLPSVADDTRSQARWFSLRRIERRELAVLRSLTHEKELTHLARLQHIAESLDRFDRDLPAGA